jgi:nucleotide-binding universal stress UspA family protein
MSTVVMAIDGTVRPHTVLPLYRSLVRVPDRVVLVQIRTSLPEQRRGSMRREGPVEGSGHVLQTIRQALESTGPVSVTTLVREGDLADAVLNVTDEERADLIIIGSRRTTGLFRLLTGRAVGNLERRTTVPVIVARRSFNNRSMSPTLNRRESYHAA